MNGKGILVSKTAKLEDFFFLCGSRLHVIEKQGMLKGVLRLEEMSQHTRFLGVAVHNMGYVAMGAVDAAMEFKLKPYDFEFHGRDGGCDRDGFGREALDA